eukprot:INCI19125.15.p1 GENE.INCI19125.15~~INCI19125.15.p1  ORF type:complete len:116 (+),score=13.29 INCI19125.15:292-639(+)
MALTKWRMATCTFFQIVMPKSRPVFSVSIAALVYGFVAYFFGAARAFVASVGGAGHCFNFLPRDSRRRGQKICANNPTNRRWPSRQLRKSVYRLCKKATFSGFWLLMLVFFYMSY